MNKSANKSQHMKQLTVIVKWQQHSLGENQSNLGLDTNYFKY